MNEIPTNIFLHFLNKDTQDIFGLKQTEDEKELERLRKGLNASILLCKDFCFIPLGFYFESKNTRHLILNNLAFIQEGLLRICIRETDVKEYLEKKKGQLQLFADDISEYRGFYNPEYEKKLTEINPVYLTRNVRVGEFCINKWQEQHFLFIENNTGDMYNAYISIDNIQDVFKITQSINNAALATKNGAFVWSIIDAKLKDLGISDLRIKQQLRKYFEKYYYEAYLSEYNASILYDLYLIDRGNDFALREEYPSVSNYAWFYEYLRCIDLEKCIDLSAEQTVQLKYMPEFIALLDIYYSICHDKLFEGSLSIRRTVANMIISNEDDINGLIEKVKQFINTPLIISRSFMEDKTKNDVVDNMKTFWKNRGASLLSEFKDKLVAPQVTPLRKELLNEKLNDCKVLVLTANYVEGVTVSRCLMAHNRVDRLERIIEDKQSYQFSKINNVPVVHIWPQRTSSFVENGSYDALEKALKRFKPEVVIAVGVAFGANPKKQRLGDVLVSDHLVLYDVFNKRTDNSMSLNPDDTHNIGGEILAGCSFLERKDGPSAYGLGDFRWYKGPMASGGTVLSDSDEKTRLMDAINKMGYSIIGGEMEGNGIYRACQGKAPFILIKGICDWAINKNGWSFVTEDEDEQKDIKDCVQALACKNAYSTLEYILSQIIPDE